MPINAKGSWDSLHQLLPRLSNSSSPYPPSPLLHLTPASTSPDQDCNNYASTTLHLPIFTTSPLPYNRISFSGPRAQLLHIYQSPPSNLHPIFSALASHQLFPALRNHLRRSNDIGRRRASRRGSPITVLLRNYFLRYTGTARFAALKAPAAARPFQDIQLLHGISKDFPSSQNRTCCWFPIRRFSTLTAWPPFIIKENRLPQWLRKASRTTSR